LTTSPAAAVGVSINYQPFFTLNATAGANEIPLKGLESKKNSTVVRINVEGWQNNRIALTSLTMNSVSVIYIITGVANKYQDALLLPYQPSKLAFQFIGDSLSSVSNPFWHDKQNTYLVITGSIS
jgi:hypothetical protein